MSLETWLAEFYPTSAYDTHEAEAIAHSLKKWEGTLPENLEKHDVFFDFDEINDGDGGHFEFDSHNCSLCYHYYDHDHGCEACPLFKHLGRACDDQDDSPYKQACCNNNTIPMIEALRSISSVNIQHNNPPNYIVEIYYNNKVIGYITTNKGRFGSLKTKAYEFDDLTSAINSSRSLKNLPSRYKKSNIQFTYIKITNKRVKC